MLKLRRLRIEKFRGVRAGTELRFSDGINVLLGQNGTGKTTLLELISMVVRSDFSSLAGEALAIEYELAIPGVEPLIVLIRNDREARPERPLGTDLPVFHRTQDVLRAAAEVFVEPPAAGRRHLFGYDAEHGFRMGEQQLFGPPNVRSCLDAGFLPRCMMMYSQIVENVRPYLDRLLRVSPEIAGRFDESLELFARLTRTSDVSGDLLHFTDKGVRGFAIENLFSASLLSETLLDKVGAAYERTRSDYAFDHKDLGFLGKIKEVMGFSKAELKVDVTARSRVEQPVGWESVRLGNLVFRFWWGGGEFITHERLSYGQKRMLTFFYYLDSNLDIVVADELVNGLHHQWIAACIEALGGRQAFLTSQNPLLLDYIPITSPEQAQHSFVLCRSERHGGRPGWSWENMDEQDAAAEASPQIFREFT